MHRRLIAALVSVALLTLLSGCALPLPIPKGPIRVPDPVEVVDGEIVEGSCLNTTNGIVGDDDGVACTGAHHADVIAFVTWPGMDELLAEWPAKTVWDELSGYYPIKGIGADYDRWAARACGDALRDLIGWDGVRVDGHDADTLQLLPGSTYDVIPAMGSAGVFSAGDHRTRCIASWYEPVSYDAGVTIADLAGPRFPSSARDCYLADDEGYLEVVPCDLAHTDQTMLMLDALAAFGSDVTARLIDPQDEATQAITGAFCERAVAAAFGPWNQDQHWVWGGTLNAPQWSAVRDAPPDPGVTYPFGCFMSTYFGEVDRGDLIAEATR
ncbi:MAG: hypothetical protein ACTHMQ_06745 [Protaetiibacter sp.]